MEYNSQHDISIGFIVYPVHDQYKRNHAHHKIDGIDETGFNQVTMIIASDGG